MTFATRLEATVAAWIATLLAAVVAPVLGVALAVLLFLTSSSWERRSSSPGSDEVNALAGVAIVAAVCALIALALARRMLPRPKRASPMGGPVVGAVLAFAATAATMWSGDVAEALVYWWAPWIVAPGIGAFLGTFVPIPIVAEFAVVAAVSAAAAVGATVYINQPAPVTAVSHVPRASGGPSVSVGAVSTATTPAAGSGTVVQASPPDAVPVPAARWHVADAAIVGVAAGTTVVRTGTTVRGLDDRGQQRWATQIEASSPTAVRGAITSEQGTTFVITAPHLTAVSKDGAVLWQRTAFPAEYETVAGVSRAGHLYVVVRDADGRALLQHDAATGAPGWRYRVGPRGTFPVSFAIGDDENLALASDTVIVSLSPRGEERWQREERGAVVAMGAAGIVCFQSAGHVEALTRDGGVLWTSAGEGYGLRWPPSLAVDGRVYAATSTLRTIDLSQPNGSTWKPPGWSVITSAPVLLASGHVAVALSDGFVAGVAREGATAWQWPAEGQPRLSKLARLVAGPLGLLVEHAGGVTLLETGGPEAGPWPQPGGCFGSTAQACPASPGGGTATGRGR